MAETTASGYIQHHLQNLTFGQLPEGGWGFAHSAGVTLLPQLHGSNWQHDETLQLLPLPVPGQGAARAIGLIERPGQHGDPVTDLIRTRCVATFLAE